MPRPISIEWTLRIKAATRDLIKACGGLERAAGVSGLSTSQLSRCQQSKIEDSPDIIGIDHAMALEEECGLALVTAVMADYGGRRLTETGAEQTQTNAVSCGAELTMTMLDASNALIAASLDGDWSASEAEAIDRRLGPVRAAMDAVAKSTAAIKASAGKPRVVSSRG